MNEQQYIQQQEEQRERFKAEHRQEFKRWFARQTFGTLQSAHSFNVGDRVTFTNDNGVTFKGHTILAINADDSFQGRQFHLDTDCYWFPKHHDNLTRETGKESIG